MVNGTLLEGCRSRGEGRTEFVAFDPHCVGRVALSAMKVDKLVAIERWSNGGSVIQGLYTERQGVDVLERRIKTLKKGRRSLEENLLQF